MHGGFAAGSTVLCSVFTSPKLSKNWAEFEQV
jgi:hypothetical protein